jgi:hypothetical protein
MIYLLFASSKYALQDLMTWRAKVCGCININIHTYMSNYVCTT